MNESLCPHCGIADTTKVPVMRKNLLIYKQDVRLLSPVQAEIFRVLALNFERPISAPDILNQLPQGMVGRWKNESGALRRHICDLRPKLLAFGFCIDSKRGSSHEKHMEHTEYTIRRIK